MMPRTSEPFDGLYPDTENERANLDEQWTEVRKIVAAAFEGQIGASLALDAIDDIAAAALRDHITPAPDA